MRVLAFDTSSRVSAVAIVDGPRVLAEDDTPSDALHGETLVPRIGALMERADITHDDLQLIAVGIGPGSFTGLRVGLATAKGLAFATGLPLRAVDSLAVLARGALDTCAPDGPVIVVPCVDAHRGEVFLGAYAADGERPLRTHVNPVCGTPAEVVQQVQNALSREMIGAAASTWPLLWCGDAAGAHGDLLARAFAGRARVLGVEHALPRGRCVAAEGARLYAQDGASDLERVEPAYLRAAEVTLPSR